MSRPAVVRPVGLTDRHAFLRVTGASALLLAATFGLGLVDRLPTSSTPSTVLAAPQAACGTRTWQQIGLSAGATIEDMSGDASLVLAGSRAVTPGEKLFRGTATASALSPLAGFLSTNASLVTVNSVAAEGNNVHVALGGGGVLSSVDGGAVFSASELVDYGITALEAGPEGLYAAASAPSLRGIYQRNPSGSWVTLAGEETFPDTVFWDLTRTPSGGLWAATTDAGPWHAPDGASFSAVNDPLLANATVLSVAVDPSDSAKVYAGLGDRVDAQTGTAYQRGLVVSSDNGRTWREALPWGTERPLVFDVAASPASPGTAYAATWGRGLLHTADGGRSWHTLPLHRDMRDATGGGYFSSLLAVQPTSNCEILLAGGLHGLWAIDIAAAAPRTIYLPRTHGVAWRALANGSTVGREESMHAEPTPAPPGAPR